MRLLLTLLIAMLVQVNLAATALGQNTSELYRAELEVADHGVRELGAATRNGLARVLVKLSGSDEVLAHKDIRKALSDSKNYLQQYQYRRADNGRLRVLIQYDQDSVMKILTDARLPLWAGQRPSVLVWIVVDAGEGRRYGLDESVPTIIASLREAFTERAVPLNVPLYDLQDRLAVEVHDLWELQRLPVLLASRRYQQQHILVARLTSDAQGRWLGDWLYVSDEADISTSMYGANADEVAAAGADLAIGAMAARYAVRPTGASHGGLLVRVDGLNQYRDYRRALNHLQGLELVESARLEFLAAGSGVFRVFAPVGELQLQQILDQAGKMRVQSKFETLQPLAAQANLVYRWLP